MLKSSILRKEIITGNQLNNQGITTQIGHYSYSWYSWLRDNCQCPLCIHKSSKQKLYLSKDCDKAIPESIEKLDQKGDTVWKIKWKGKWTKPHQSTFSESSLNRVIKAHENDMNLFKPTLWDSKNLFKEEITIPHSSLETPEGLKTSLSHLRKYGLCFLKNSTSDLDMLKKTALKYGLIQNTFYGEVWDVKNQPLAKNIAYTDLAIWYHMDLMYFESPPAIQFLHSIKNTTKGGQTIFLDSFNAANILRKEDPDAFKTLCEVPVTFQYINDNKNIIFKRPTFRIDDPNEELQVYYAPNFTGSIDNNQPNVNKFYSAMNAFEEILKRPGLSFSTRLEAGDLVLFMNRRIFHAREAYDSNSGERHFRGTYVGYECYKNSIRKHFS